MNKKLIFGIMIWIVSLIFAYNIDLNKEVVAEKSYNNEIVSILNEDYNNRVLENKNSEIENLNKQISELESKLKVTEKKISSNRSNSGRNFTATGYDLSVASCGKSKSHPQYGVTRSGFNLSGHTRESAMVIATDPNVIPLGTKVKVTFPEPYEHFGGIYESKDTGSAIKGNIIDIFMGENVSREEVMRFGRRKVKVEVLE